MKKLMYLALLLIIPFALCFSACEEEVGYTIKFIVDGQEYATAKIENNDVIRMPQKPTKYGYTFGGWFWDDGTFERPLTVNSWRSEPLSNDMYVFVKWIEPPSYSISYVLNGGTNNDSNPTVFSSLMNNILLLNATKDHYDFVGWSINGNMVTEIDTTISSEIVVTAIFTPTIYSITYVLNGATNSDNNPTTYTIETPTITLQPAIFHNESVSRWFLQGTNNRVTQIAKGSSGNKTFYARSGYTDDEMYKLSGSVLIGVNRSLISEFHISNLVIPSTVSSIQSKVFYNCTDLESVTISDSVTTIGEMAFGGCDNLKNVLIGNGVKKIDKSAFSNCTAITKVIIDDLSNWIDINFVDSYAHPLVYSGNLYNNDTLITNLIIPNGITNIKSYVFYHCNSIINVVISDSVVSICDHAFSGCNGLTSITIPNNIKNIDEQAFSCCNNLSSVFIGAGVTSISSTAFMCCDALTNISVDEDNQVYDSRDNCNAVILGQALILGCSTTIIPISISMIWRDAFYLCRSLTRITIPGNIKYIYDRAFSHCSNLRNVELPNGLVYIGAEAFYNCSSLESIIIPQSVTEIYKYAFSGVAGYIYCEAVSKPTSWDYLWDWDNSKVPFYEAFQKQIYWYCSSKPSSGQGYWHYVDGEPEFWE